MQLAKLTVVPEDPCGSRMSLFGISNKRPLAMNVSRSRKESPVKRSTRLPLSARANEKPYSARGRLENMSMTARSKLSVVPPRKMRRDSDWKP